MPIFFFFFFGDIVSLELAMQIRLALNSKISAAGAGVLTSPHPACQHYSVKTAFSSSVFVNCLTLI